MRNVMLGHSGDGKTTFVAAAYARLQEPVAGFTLHSHVRRDHRELMTRAANITKGHYPDGTTKRTEYWFDLRHDGTSVLTFSWADYRGGALTDAASASDTQQILADLREADAIQVFVDAAAVATGKRVRSQLGRITSLLAEALSGVTRPLPVAVVLTKYDLVPARQRNDKLLEPVRGLLGAVRQSETITGSVFRVAAGPQARDLERPVLFALRHGLTAEHDRRAALVSERHDEWHRLHTEAQTWRQERERHAREIKDNPIWTYLKYLFNDTDHYAGEANAGRQAEEKAAAAERAWNEAKAREAELERLMPSVHALDEFLQDLETF